MDGGGVSNTGIQRGQGKTCTHTHMNFICGLRVGARGATFQGISGKTGPLRGLWMAHLLSLLLWKRTHLGPRPLKSLLRGPESLSGALRGLWEGVSETPNYWNEGSNSEAPKGPQNLWTPEPGFAPPVPPLGPQLRTKLSEPDMTRVHTPSTTLNLFQRSLRWSMCGMLHRKYGMMCTPTRNYCEIM